MCEFTHAEVPSAIVWDAEYSLLPIRKFSPTTLGKAPVAVEKIAMSEAVPKILDLTYLAEAADGDIAFIDEILGDYLVEMARLLSELDHLIDGSELKTLVRSAHTIKGASANVGAVRVRETAAKLEAQANKGSVEGGESLVNLLRQEVARVKELVEREGVENLLRATG